MAVVKAVTTHQPVEQIAATFHRTMTEIILTCCLRVRDEGGANTVALSGGTFQNMLLLEGTRERLRNNDFMVCSHRRVPPYDGGKVVQSQLADHVIVVRSDYIPRIQEVQASVWHVLRRRIDDMRRTSLSPGKETMNETRERPRCVWPRLPSK